MGKLFNKVLNTRLVDHLEETGTLSDNQAAYRKGYSTTDHIFSLKSIINKYVTMNKARLYCCFVDFQKAFDSVPREALLLKLLRLNINGKLYNIIKAYVFLWIIKGKITTRYHHTLYHHNRH